MCEMCEMYGDPKYGGGRWYLNPKNYGRQLYTVHRPGERRKVFGEDPELAMGALMWKALSSKWEDPDHFDENVREFSEANLWAGGSYVITLEEAFQVVELSYPIAAMQCMCRTALRAEEETNMDEYTCTCIGPGCLKWERWPERYKGGVEFMTVEQAKEWLTKLDKEGFMHLIMVLEQNYVGGICNCDYPDCLAIRDRLDYGTIPSLHKGHYVASIDYDQCNGCGICMQRCHYGALRFEYSYAMNKPNIDQFKCFGCGMCSTGCPRGAITMVERESIPLLKGVW